MTSETVQRPFRETGLKWIAGGSAIEAIGALAVIALAIVGLAGILSETVAAIATIILGAAILTQGGAFAAGHFASGAYETQVREPAGMSASFLGGVAGIVLGILALLGISAPTLLSIAVLVFGGSFLVGLSGFPMASNGSEGFSGPSGGQIMAGLAAVVLGILAVVGVSQLTLVLVALLCLGAFALFNGSSVGARSVSAVTR